MKFTLLLNLKDTRKLKYLNLSRNYFREEGGRLLGDAISYNDGLEELDLSWNHLRRGGASSLAMGIMVYFTRLHVHTHIYTES